MNPLLAVAAWIGDTAARIAIRIGAGVQLAAAVAEAWTTAEPESPLTWEMPAPRFDTRAVWLIADKASVDKAIAAIVRVNAPVQQGEQPN